VPGRSGALRRKESFSMNLKWLLFSFKGRIGRQTYWFASLAFMAAFLFSGMLVDVLGEDTGGIVVLLLVILIGYMSIAVAAKRWHDRDKSGWWSLIALIPIVGSIWMLIENGFLRGTQGPNRFGPDPIRPPGPVPVVHEGQTYYRQPNGGFTDALGSPVTSVALVAALGAAYLAMRSAAPDTWSNDSWDRNDTTPSESSSSSSESSSSGGSWWSSSSSDSSNSGWSSDTGGGGGSD
jgi:uncharacterized membrane protein YhaH (DUF805 family)